MGRDAWFSNYGKNSVGIFAPGSNILAPVPGQRYEAYSGTSMAAPLVARTAALMLEAFPEPSVQQLRTAIMETARTHDAAQNPLSVQDKSISRGRP